MARTRASIGAKMSSAKSAKARAVSSSSGSSSFNNSGSNDKTRNYSGGNPVCPRETPKWQKPITGFFQLKEKQHSVEEVDEGSTSKPKRRTRNIIESDDENDIDDKPRNSVLDETIELEELSGENSHKIEEYYKDSDDNKEGRDKEDKEEEEMEVEIDDKENHTNNKDDIGIEDIQSKRKSVKRDLESSNDDVQESKRVRIESD